MSKNMPLLSCKTCRILCIVLGCGLVGGIVIGIVFGTQLKERTVLLSIREQDIEKLKREVDKMKALSREKHALQVITRVEDKCDDTSTVKTTKTNADVTDTTSSKTTNTARPTSTTSTETTSVTRATSAETAADLTMHASITKSTSTTLQDSTITTTVYTSNAPSTEVYFDIGSITDLLKK